MTDFAVTRQPKLTSSARTASFAAPMAQPDKKEASTRSSRLKPADLAKMPASSPHSDITVTQGHTSPPADNMSPAAVGPPMDEDNDLNLLAPQPGDKDSPSSTFVNRCTSGENVDDVSKSTTGAEAQRGDGSRYEAASPHTGALPLHNTLSRAPHPPAPLTLPTPHSYQGMAIDPLLLPPSTPKVKALPPPLATPTTITEAIASPVSRKLAIIRANCKAREKNKKLYDPQGGKVAPTKFTYIPNLPHLCKLQALTPLPHLLDAADKQAEEWDLVMLEKVVVQIAGPPLKSLKETSLTAAHIRTLLNEYKMTILGAENSSPKVSPLAYNPATGRTLPWFLIYDLHPTMASQLRLHAAVSHNLATFFVCDPDDQSNPDLLFTIEGVDEDEDMFAMTVARTWSEPTTAALILYTLGFTDLSDPMQVVDQIIESIRITKLPNKISQGVDYPHYNIYTAMPETESWTTLQDSLWNILYIRRAAIIHCPYQPTTGWLTQDAQDLPKSWTGKRNVLQNTRLTGKEPKWGPTEVWTSRAKRLKPQHNLSRLSRTNPNPPTNSTGIALGNGLDLNAVRGGRPQTTGNPPNDDNRENGGGPHNSADQQPQTRGNRHTSRNTRANIQLATLNMKGRASALLGHSQISKWTEVYSMMKEKQIGILALQETHLTEENVFNIKKLFGRRLEVWNSSDPEQPGASAGVAFVINREIANTMDLELEVLVPGQAISLTTQWHNSEKMMFLNVYAPNCQEDHPHFWKTVGEQREILGILIPDFMMGDFNIVKDAIDRAPARLDSGTATEALHNLRHGLQLTDAWRQEFPNKHQFTFHNRATDHIYGWECAPAPVPTNHSMVSLRFSPTTVPEIGEGRWTWPIGLVDNEKLLKSIETIGRELQGEVDSQAQVRNGDKNLQILWERFKTQMCMLAKKAAKTTILSMKMKVAQLRKDAMKTANNPRIDNNPDLRMHEAVLNA
ncbi:hypothetical protein JAAARDRAFT_47183 [Jaapia argillacea MUCL 33604]|uniref:Endonuclease/exonuclease/phosphatase domain-containing protein n=1 Tax=Jaapia argillacea MUCL 33604 TaxID=933084 RepID=A0A067PVR5_9AGAM|nr:hypothetical protein JAAARDRAFT_47183 [Jaapia argillacea MUCL 33604]